MKLYLIRVLQNNDDIRNEELREIIAKNEGMMCQQTLEETMKYLITFAFKTREQRENVSDKMQQIRYEYEDIEMSDRLLARSSEITSSIYTGYERMKRKSEKTEKILENIFKERNIKYFKTVLKDVVLYDFINRDDKMSSIVIKSNNKSIGLRKEYGTWKCDRKNKYEEALEFLVETETVEDEETK